ncbi:MAG: hypothetical protein IJX06_01620 [Clostridia bacterium]|nr:hypothetical protein [Clostridia bacterium]
MIANSFAPTVGRGLAPTVVYASTCFGHTVGAIHESPVSIWQPYQQRY